MKNPIFNISQLFFMCIIVVCVADGQSLHDYLQLAAENNPALKARFNEYQASLQKIPQASSLPDPQLSFGLFIMPMERYNGNQVAQFSLMQMFPWFGTLGSARNEALQMAKARYEAFNEARSILLYEVKEQWYSLYLLEKEITITEENLDILKTIEVIALSRYTGDVLSGDESNGNISSTGNRTTDKSESSGSVISSGGMNSMQGQTPLSPGSMSSNMDGTGNMDKMDDGSMVNVLQAQIEINVLQNRLLLLKDNRKVLIAQFNQLLNRPINEPVLLPDSITEISLTVPIAEIPDSIRENNPMLKMLESEEESFRSAEKMNRRMGFPMLGLGIQYDIFQPRANSQSEMNGRDMFMPMATISLPVWRKKYNSSIKEAGLMRENVIEQRQETLNLLQVSYEEAMRDFHDAERRNKLYQNQVELARKAYNISLTQYSTAGKDFDKLLIIQQQILDYRQKNIEAVIDKNIATARLERLMGR